MLVWLCDKMYCGDISFILRLLNGFGSFYLASLPPLFIKINNSILSIQHFNHLLLDEIWMGQTVIDTNVLIC